MFAGVVRRLAPAPVVVPESQSSPWRVVESDPIVSHDQMIDYVWWNPVASSCDVFAYAGAQWGGPLRRSGPGTSAEYARVGPGT